MFNKKAAGEMTVPRLVKYVLLIVVLILVVYGFSHDLMQPLTERVKGMADEVAILLHIKSPAPSGGCFIDSLLNMGSSGKSLADEIGLQGGERFEASFSVCSNLTCILKAGGKSYKLEDNNFYVSSGDSWMSGDSYLFENEKDLRFYRDLYESSVVFILENLGKSSERINRNYNSGDLTGFIGLPLADFNLTAMKDLDEPESFSAYATWKDGYWNVRSFDKPQLSYSDEDDEEALNTFYDIVHPPWPERDLEIRANVGNSQKRLSEIIETKNEQLDSKGELIELKDFFSNFKRSSFEKNRPSAEETANLKNLMDGKNISADGKVYFVEVESENRYPLLKMSSGSEIYGLGFYSNLGVWTFADSNPLALFEYSEGKWNLLNGRDFYKLSDEKFEEISDLNKIYKFIEDKCN